MVVIASGADEGGRIPDALHQLESEHSTIEGERAFQVGHLQVHVPDSDPTVDGLTLGHYSDLRRLERGSFTTVPLLNTPRMHRSRQATEAS